MRGVHSQKCTSCNQSCCWHFETTCYNKLISECICMACNSLLQQVCCKLSTTLLQLHCPNLFQQACCKLFQQIVTSLQMTSCNKPDFNRLVATWWNWQACCNLLTRCNKSVKLTTCNLLSLGAKIDEWIKIVNNIAQAETGWYLLFYNLVPHLPPPSLTHPTVRSWCKVMRTQPWQDFYFILFSFATRAGSPQQHEPITVDPYYLTPLSTFPVGGNRCTRRKPTTFGRALTILFSHEDWVWVHIKVNLTGDQTRILRGERQVVWPLHDRNPICMSG